MLWEHGKSSKLTPCGDTFEGVAIFATELATKLEPKFAGGSNPNISAHGFWELFLCDQAALAGHWLNRRTLERLTDD